MALTLVLFPLSRQKGLAINGYNLIGKIVYDTVNPACVTLGKLLMIQNIEKVIERVMARGF